MKTTKNKYFYYVFTIEKNGQFYNYVEKVRNYNLKALIDSNPNIIIVHPTATKKEAEFLATFWNDCAVQNGNYMY